MSSTTPRRRPTGGCSTTSQPQRASRPDRHARARRRRRRPRPFFGGRTPSELRLWDALEADLLCPFHYFGIADDVDLTALDWTRGGYDDGALDRLTPATTRGPRSSSRSCATRSPTPADAGAGLLRLGRARRVHGARLHRARHPGAGRVGRRPRRPSGPRRSTTCGRGEVNVLFAVDLFNEGLDLRTSTRAVPAAHGERDRVPAAARPRTAPTPDKAVLTVLDFIGQQRREFRFDLRTALSPARPGAVSSEQVERGFPFLPSGCQLVLDRVASARPRRTCEQAVAAVARDWSPTCGRTATST